MANYITTFDTHAEYNSATTLNYPNVSVINEDMSVIYAKEAPTPVFGGKYKFTLSDSSVVSAECDATSAITYANTSAYQATVTDAIIGDCVTTIEGGAFQFFSNLTSVDISNSVTSIGDAAFASCPNLTSVTIGSGVTSIGWSAFSNCSGLTSVTIPSGVTSIGHDAFSETPWWNTYSADASHHYGNIIYINDIAYVATSNGITSVSFKENTIAIGYGAFSGCSELTSVTIPDSVTSIGSNAFNGCSSLTSVDIPSGVTSIENSTFRNCSGLTSITIPNSVTNIGNYAFTGCSSLTSIIIPNSVTSLGTGAFRNCSSLTSITVETTTPPTLGSNVFNNTNDCPIYVPSVSLEDYKTAWSSYADRIQAIPSPEPTFKYKFTLNDDSVVSAECDATSAITSAETSEYKTTLVEAEIGDCVTNIGKRAFQGCSGLTSVTINATTPPTLGSGALDSSSSNEYPIYVPSESVDIYRSAGGLWSSKYYDRIQPIP